MEKLDGFHPQTRIWVYQSNRFLAPNEIERINIKLEDFSKEWATHGSKMKTACFVIEPCFIIMAVDQSEMAASGCSIDSSVKVLKEIEVEFNIDLFDRLNLSYIDQEGRVQLIKMEEFQKGIAEGLFNEETLVFNNLVDNLEDFKQHWKTTVANSWHRNLV